MPKGVSNSIFTIECNKPLSRPWMDKVGSPPQHRRSSRDAWNHRAQRRWRRRRGRRGRRSGAARHGAAAADDDALWRLWSEGRSHNTHAGSRVEGVSCVGVN